MGKHLILDCSGAKKLKFNDVYEILDALPAEIKMNKLCAPYVMKGAEHNPGFTGFIVIEQSHISIHTFTKSDLISIDVYSCKDFNEKIVLTYLKNKKIKIINSQLILRKA